MWVGLVDLKNKLHYCKVLSSKPVLKHTSLVNSFSKHKNPFVRSGYGKYTHYLPNQDNYNTVSANAKLNIKGDLGLR